MEYYYNPYKDVKVTRSFAGFLRLKIRDTILGVEEKGKLPYNKETGEVENFDTLDFIFEDGNNINREDKNSTEALNNLNEDLNKIYLYKYVSELIFTMNEYCSYEDYFMMIMALDIYLEKGEKHVNAFFKHFNRKGKVTFNTTLDILKEELIKKVKESHGNFEC